MKTKRTVNGIELLGQRGITFEGVFNLSIRQQINVAAIAMAAKASWMSDKGCPRTYGLSDPFTREKKKNYPKGSHACALFQVGSGCEGCWRCALKERYPMSQDHEPKEK